jgi:hypothetical protein
MTGKSEVRFWVLTASNMKITTFWDIETCSLVEGRSWMMEAVRTSETSVCFNDTTLCYIPEGFCLQIWSNEQAVTISVQSENHATPVNTLFAQNWELSKAKAGGTYSYRGILKGVEQITAHFNLEIRWFCILAALSPVPTELEVECSRWRVCDGQNTISVSRSEPWSPCS